MRNSSKYLVTIRGIPAPISTGSRRNDNRFRESVKRGVKCIRARHALYDILHIYYKCTRRADFLIFLLLKSCRVETDPLPHTVGRTYSYFYKQKIFIIKDGSMRPTERSRQYVLVKCIQCETGLSRGRFAFIHSSACRKLDVCLNM